MTWERIETAPKDGTRILLALLAVDKPGEPPSWFISLGWWDPEFDGEWSDEVGDIVYRGAWTDGGVASWAYEEHRELGPTHWMPLPEPPIEHGEGGE
jgi:hypothetical protein